MDNQDVPTQLELLQPVIENGDTIKILQILQQNDVDVTAVDDDGDTVLHLILRSVNFAPLLSPSKIIEMMDIVISRGVDPNIKNKNQETALHLAIASQLKDVFDYLLKHKSNINVVDDKGNSVAHYFIISSCELFRKKQRSGLNTRVYDYAETAKKIDSSFVEWLISRGVDFDLKNAEGQSALHLAIILNMQHILATLFKNTLDINFVTEVEKQNLLYLSLKKFYENPRLYSFKAYYFCQGSNCRSLFPLISENFPSDFAVEMVQILLDRGVSVDHEDKNGLTPLHLAIRYKVQMSIVSMIMDRFVNISDEMTVTLVHEIVNTVICRSSSPCFDHLKILDILTTRVININVKDANGKTCLYHVVKYDDLKAFKLLQRRDTLDFSVLTNDGENLLHALAKNGTSPLDKNVIFDLLISEGCDVRAKDCKGRTPLHWAAYCRNYPIAQRLIAHGAEVNCREYEKESCPLHEAIDQDSMEVAELLLDNGANANGMSKEGRPLHLEPNYISKSTIVTLLKYKAEVNARDHRGDTALAKALVYKNVFYLWNIEDKMQTLLEHGADIDDISVIHVLPHCDMDRHTSKILLKHWIKLRTANLPCSNKYQTYIVASEKYEQVRKGCLREIDRMKSTFIDTHTSLYAWLHMDPNRRYAHSQNEKLRKIVDSPAIKEQFPQYSTVILSTYRDTLARKLLLEPAKKAWLELTGIHLPDLCIERVFAYLNTGDLFEMSEMI